MNGPTDEASREAAELWLRYSSEDLSAALALMGHPDVPPRHACWLAQQAAEKALKAALCALRIDFARTHNLNFLRDLLPPGWVVKEQYPELADLTQWAVEARYPGAWPDPTLKDAEQAVCVARGVVDAVVRDLSERRLPTGGGA